MSDFYPLTKVNTDVGCGHRTISIYGSYVIERGDLGNQQITIYFRTTGCSYDSNQTVCPKVLKISCQLTSFYNICASSTFYLTLKLCYSNVMNLSLIFWFFFFTFTISKFLNYTMLLSLTTPLYKESLSTKTSTFISQNRCVHVILPPCNILTSFLAVKL